MKALPPPLAENSVSFPDLDQHVRDGGGAASRLPDPMLIGEWLNSSPRLGVAGRQRRWTVRGPLASSSTSLTYRAVCPGTPGLFLKRPQPGGESASEQYDALIKAHAQLAGSPRFRVPTAYPDLLDRGFLVTDWIEGPVASRLLESMTVRPRSAVDAVERAGRWLRAFHGRQAETSTVIDAKKLINDAHWTITRFNDWRAAPAAFKGHLALLEQTSPALEKLPIQVSLLHGDFKPPNLILSPDSVFGVDVSARFVGAVVDDLAHFLIHLDLTLFEPYGCRLLPWSGSLERAFLRGYNADGIMVPYLAVAWCRLQRVLRHYHMPMENEGNRIRGMLRKLCYGWCAERSARQLRRAWKASDPRH